MKKFVLIIFLFALYHLCFSQRIIKVIPNYVLIDTDKNIGNLGDTLEIQRIENGKITDAGRVKIVKFGDGKTACSTLPNYFNILKVGDAVKEYVLRYSYDNKYYAISIRDFDLRESAGDFRTSLIKVPINSLLTIKEFKLRHLKVEYKGIEGYTIPTFLQVDDTVLNKFKSMYEEQMNAIKKQAEIIKIKLLIRLEEIRKKPFWISAFIANVRNVPSINSEIIDELEQGEQIFEQKRENEWVNIKYYKKEWGELGKISDELELGNIKNEEELNTCFNEGWIHRSLLSETKIEKISEYEREAIKRRQNFVKKNPNIKPLFRNDILKGSIRIGMTKDMVRASWGEPEDRNRSVGSWGVHEQWIYNNTYIYFENDIMTSFQD